MRCRRNEATDTAGRPFGQTKPRRRQCGFGETKPPQGSGGLGGTKPARGSGGLWRCRAITSPLPSGPLRGEVSWACEFWRNKANWRGRLDLAKQTQCGGPNTATRSENRRGIKMLHDRSRSRDRRKRRVEDHSSPSLTHSGGRHRIQFPQRRAAF